jgi:hypothetical protein
MASSTVNFTFGIRTTVRPGKKSNPLSILVMFLNPEEGGSRILQSKFCFKYHCSLTCVVANMRISNHSQLKDLVLWIGTSK